MVLVKKALIIFFKTHYIIHSEATTNHGYSIAYDPYLRCTNTASNKELADALLNALDGSRQVNKTWEDFPTKYYLAALGLSNIGQLHKDTHSCVVYSRDETIFLIPTLNLGARNGFKHMPEQKVAIPENATHDEIAKAIKDALDRCG